MTITRHGITEATNGLPIISRAVVRGDEEPAGTRVRAGRPMASEHAR